LSDLIQSPTLSRADSIINGERQSTYGSPEDSFQIIAELWDVYLKHRKPGNLRPDDIAIMMSLFKHARILGQKFSKDNAIDACGYLAIYNDRLNK